MDLGANCNSSIALGFGRLRDRQKTTLAIDKAIPGLIEVRFDPHFH
jgi:hypothetical protein